MKKTKSIRKGNVWLNVFQTDDGDILVTLNKTYRNQKGEWKKTNFLNPRRGDLYDLLDILKELNLEKNQPLLA